MEQSNYQGSLQHFKYVSLSCSLQCLEVVSGEALRCLKEDARVKFMFSGMTLLKLAGLRGTERRFSPPHGTPALSLYRAVAQLHYLPTHALFNCRKLGRACVPSPNPCPADLAVEPSPSKGYIQAVDKEGRPLCLRCQQPTCQPEQGSKASAWDSRFCSLKCQEEFWIRSNNSYLRAQVFAAEHGVCQLCSVNAQELFLRVRDAPKSQRKNLLDAAWRAKLPLEQVGFHHVSGAVVQSTWMLTNSISF